MTEPAEQRLEKLMSDLEKLVHALDGSFRELLVARGELARIAEEVRAARVREAAERGEPTPVDTKTGDAPSSEERDDR
jgi:hypothetical protein